MSKNKEMPVVFCCRGDGSSVLWRTEAKIQMTYKGSYGIPCSYMTKCTLTSWKQSFVNMPRCMIPISVCEVTLDIEAETESFASRPILDVSFDDDWMREHSDVILVLEGQKFPVNKMVLSVHSSYFNSLFYGGFKEQNLMEIEIKDTNPEDFHELLYMVYGKPAHLKREDGVVRYLRMADMFDLQIVKDRVENSLLSMIKIHANRKLLIADQHKMEVLKKELIHDFNEHPRRRTVLFRSEEFAQMSTSLKESWRASIPYLRHIIMYY
ncbi:hypothetical protein PENTCL1PPCAC_13920 [Pristionchus entomophagus]|uniref:BTB domain-containing protein n=1 Tax=Pristionchus entomophagus TaxID=358040 RepID=A0AAV5T836_9BILA|nr:hypothetical protein PENTCL1PPCAC_13920 [Pristionchus entomophagus]